MGRIRRVFEEGTLSMMMWGVIGLLIVGYGSSKSIGVLDGWSVGYLFYVLLPFLIIGSIWSVLMVATGFFHTLLILIGEHPRP